MNLFWREIRSYRKSLFFWSLAMLFLVGSGMAKFAVYSGGGQSLTSVIAQFPKSIQTIFGLTGFDLNTAIGDFGVLFVYIVLTATVHAVLLGTDIIAKEERDRTSEFLFVKPISRARVIGAKLLAGLTNLVILNIVTMAAAVYFVGYFGHGQVLGSETWVLAAGLFFMQLLFFLAGTMMAAIVKKPKTAAGLATAVLLVTYLITYVIALNQNLSGLKYLTPFAYFDARNLLADHNLDPVFVALSILLAGIMVWLTYRAYGRRDLNI